MRGSTIANSSTLEVNRLKRENKELAELIGYLTLIEEIYQTIYYYNNQRTHTSIKMAPVSFRYIYEERLLRQTV